MSDNYKPAIAFFIAVNLLAAFSLLMYEVAPDERKRKIYTEEECAEKIELEMKRIALEKEIEEDMKSRKEKL